jgi:putative effector of murein hydrolase LrgA (UPF0299 family)
VAVAVVSVLVVPVAASVSGATVGWVGCIVTFAEGEFVDGGCGTVFVTVDLVFVVPVAVVVVTVISTGQLDTHPSQPSGQRSNLICWLLQSASLGSVGQLE